MAKRDYHVVPHHGGWAVRREGSERVSSAHNTQGQAIEAGRQFAQDQRTDLIIHRPNGQIRDADSNGNDPMPPRDTKH